LAHAFCERLQEDLRAGELGEARQPVEEAEQLVEFDPIGAFGEQHEPGREEGRGGKSRLD
jgi:hypothetical protein